jgi:molecular chaperone GrpE (heat shock protein)
MDLTIVVGIGAIVVPVISAATGYLWVTHQKRITKLEDTNASQSKALTDFQLQHEKDKAEIELKQAVFEKQAYRDFITQPALTQVMTSLDQTLVALSDLMKENQRETRTGLNALNGRIDSIINPANRGRS